MDKVAVLFTMKSCPFCVELKEMLDKSNIQFVDRDIDDYEEDSLIGAFPKMALEKVLHFFLVI